MSEAFDIIVAGGGIAGLGAGHEAATLGASVLVLTGDVPGGNLLSIERVENWPGHPDGIAGYALCPDIQLVGVSQCIGHVRFRLGDGSAQR